MVIIVFQKGQLSHVKSLGIMKSCSIQPFSVHETIFGLVLKENHFVLKSMRNLDAKHEV